MRVQHLTLKGFKSIEDEQLQLHDSLNIFIGKNNSGKSNVLESIIYFMPAGFETDRLSKEDRAAELTINIRLTPGDQKELGVTGTTMTLYHTGPGERTCKVGGQTISKSKISAFLTKHVRHINTSLIFMKPESGWKTSGLIARDQLMKDIRVMKSQYPAAAKKFNTAMAKCFPHVDAPRSSSIAERKSAQIVESGRNVQPQRMGMGYRQVFVMLFYLYFPETQLLIVDEPENHLHPHLQRKVLEFMEAESRRTQLWISTHSPQFVEPHTIPHLFRVMRDALGTHVHPRTHNKQQKLDIERLVQEINPESSEVLFADHVILVEGEADEIFLKGLIRRFYPGHHDITVMAVHSNTNFVPFRQVLQYLEIPHTIMTDYDSLRGPIDVIAEVIGTKRVRKADGHMLRRLREQGIVVLPHGDLEHHYPRKYQRRESTKTINALHAARKITEKEYRGQRMRAIRTMIESL